MDFFDFMVSWGNHGVIAYYNQVLGWGYVVLKLSFYLLLLGGVLWYVLQKMRYKLAVDIAVVGTNNTIIEFHDTARYTNNGTKIKLRRRRLVLSAPDKKCITAITGKLFVKGKLRLYQYGETEFSYTPISTSINEDNEIKFKAIDPKLSMLESLNKNSRDKFGEKKSVLLQYAPVLVGLAFVAACFIMLIIATEQIKPLLSSAGTLLSHAENIMAQANAERVVASAAGVL